MLTNTCNTEWDRLGDGNCHSEFAIIRLKTMPVSEFQTCGLLSLREAPAGDSVARGVSSLVLSN